MWEEQQREREGMPEVLRIILRSPTLPKDCKMCEEYVFWGYWGSSGDGQKGPSLYSPPLFKSPSLLC